MPWTEQDLRAVLRDQVAVAPSAPDRGAAVHARIKEQQRRTNAAVALALVLLVALAVGAATRLLPLRQSMPPPAGPQVGQDTVLFSDTAGDLRVLDPATGRSSTLILGAHAAGPIRTPDGQHLLFLRTDEKTFYRSNLDGTGARPFATAAVMDNWDYSPTGDRIAAVAPDGTLGILDAATGARRAVPLPQKVREVWWTGEDRLLLYAGDGQVGGTALWTINSDGAGQTALSLPDVCCGAAVQKGTDRMAWTSWDSSAPGERQGRIHVRDLSTGHDVLLANTQVSGMLFLDPQFSPDGRWLAVQAFNAGGQGKHLALIAADGSGEAVLLDPYQGSNQSIIHAVFSPDSTQLLVMYADDTSTWIYDVPSGTGTKPPWQGLVEATWLG